TRIHDTPKTIRSDTKPSRRLRACCAAFVRLSRSLKVKRRVLPPCLHRHHAAIRQQYLSLLYDMHTTRLPHPLGFPVEETRYADKISACQAEFYGVEKL